MALLLDSNAPHIRACDFDNEAIAFLKQYYPQALDEPVAVPILHIARHKMGLRVVEHRLSEDFSILGQMCFTNGVEDIYDKDNDEYKAVKVRYGTMILDPDTIAERNEGCKNNTIAHECFHWHKHRDYYIAVSIVDPNKRTIKSSYDGKPETTRDSWTDEDWMEWQARNIAPRILMPINTFTEKAETIIANTSDIPAWFRHKSVVEQLAKFFNVSKQSAEIRLSELGILVT